MTELIYNEVKQYEAQNRRQLDSVIASVREQRRNANH